MEALTEMQQQYSKNSFIKKIIPDLSEFGLVMVKDMPRESKILMTLLKKVGGYPR